MTGFRRSRKFSYKRTHGMLRCHIVVDTPVRSKAHQSSPRRPLTQSRSRSWRGDNLSGDLMPLQGVSLNQAPRRAHLSDIRAGARSLSPSSAHPLTTARSWAAHILAGAFATERRMAIRWSSVSDDPLGACWHTGGWRRTSKSRLRVQHADPCGDLGRHVPERSSQRRGWFVDHDRFTRITPNSQ